MCILHILPTNFLPKTLAGTWGCVAEAEVQPSRLGAGRGMCQRQEVASCRHHPRAASHSTTVELEGALSWLWSIICTWKAVKPFRSGNSSTAFNWTIYSFKFMDFAGQVSGATAGLDSSTARPDMSRALLPGQWMPVTDLFLDYLSCSLHLLNGKPW